MTRHGASSVGRSDDIEERGLKLRAETVTSKTKTDSKLPSFLANENLRLIVFGGKGGTGKTTSAAATALYLAKLRPEKRVLVISLDPAHSLGDSFGCSIGATKTPIGGTPNLWALEIEPSELLGEFKEDHRREIRRTVSRAGILHQVDVKEFLSFSLPGMEQMMTFVEIVSMLKSTWFHPGEYDLIIVDTPPTGHALRLLTMPESTDKWVDVFDTALSKYRIFNPPKVYPYSKHRIADSVDQFVEKLRGDLEEARSLLTNAQETEFVPVTIPESMSLSETEDLVASLEEMRTPLRNIVINRLQAEGECDFCSARAGSQRGPVAEIEERFSRFNLIRVPLFPHEVQGEEDLGHLGEILAGTGYRFPTGRPAEPLLDESPVATANVSGLLERELQFILFSGKGGVGKTSIAAATALRMAKQYPNKRVLLYSLDPAHSLADSFASPIGDRIVSMPGASNLYAAELDPEKLRQDFMDEYRAIIRDAFDAWERKRGVKLEIRLDRNVMVTFARTSPPGIEEVIVLERIMEFVERGEYDLYILDTAPTGHLLGLLEFPQLVRDWLSYAYRGLGKWHRETPLANLQTLGDRIMKSTIAVRNIRTAITDPQKSELVVVTIPEAMAIEETKRLLTSVQGLGVSCHHVIMNMVVPPTECTTCAGRRKEQQKYIQGLTDWKPPDHLLTQVAQFPHEIRGTSDLARLGDVLYGQ